MRYLLLILACLLPSLTLAKSVAVNLQAACDIEQLELKLIDRQRAPYDIFMFELEMTLTEAAAQRFSTVTRENMRQMLVLSINHVPLTSATIQGVLGAKMRVVITAELAQRLLPALQDKRCPLNAAAATADMPD